MPPRKREAANKQAGMEFFASLLKETGHVNADAAIKEAYEAPVVRHDTRMLQAEGVLLHIYNAQRTMMHKYCKRCNEVFSTRYQAVAYCSDLCRQKAMEAIGIRWNPRTDHYENMDAERPIIVSPSVHSVILQAARRILEDQNILVEEESKPQEQEAHQDSPENRLLEFLQGPNAAQVLLQDDQEEKKFWNDLPTNPDELPPPSNSLSLDFLESPFHP